MGDSSKHIIDSFGREHDYLRISLTDRCNLRCFYCMPEEGVPLRDKKEFMTSEEVIEIASKFVELGIKKIRLTGGEPLIKKDAPNIIRSLGKLPVELTLTTNAILIDKFIDVFKEAGIKSVNVSLDSLDAEKFNQISRRNYFDRILANIKLLIESGIGVKINAVIMKDLNEHEIPDFIKLTIDDNVDVRFIEFMPFDGNKWNWNKKVSFDQMVNIALDYFGQKRISKIDDEKNGTSRNYKLEGAKGTFGIISSITNPFCDTCNRIRLTADGKIKNCLFSNDEVDLLSALRNGVEMEELIRGSILSKHKERGGLPAFEQLDEDDINNRAMVSIGG